MYFVRDREWPASQSASAFCGQSILTGFNDPRHDIDSCLQSAIFEATCLALSHPGMIELLSSDLRIPQLS